MHDQDATRLPELDAAWETPGHGPRLAKVLAAAAALRERFRSSPRCLSVTTLPITTLVYPTKYAFWAAAWSPAPWVVLTHRALLVQYLRAGRVRTLLFNPSDPVANRATPFFRRIVDRVGEQWVERLAKKMPPLEHQLAALGLSTGDVDYVAFDHFHTQDLRPLLGTVDGRFTPRFPNARLLAPRAEWEDWDCLHPLQRAWFIEDGKRGVPPERVVLTDGDLELGDGVWLLRTPGHTRGNQTLFVHTGRGVWGCSENGTSADSWAPRESRIRGLRELCRAQELDFVLNANTPEYGATQYTSMALEHALVDRVPHAPGFVQMFPSSEVTPSPLAPGLRPSLVHRAVEHGRVVPSAEAGAAQ